VSLFGRRTRRQRCRPAWAGSLRKSVLARIAANGGNVPEELLD
jgi:hypothetical protein